MTSTKKSPFVDPPFFDRTLYSLFLSLLSSVVIIYERHLCQYLKYIKDWCCMWGTVLDIQHLNSTFSSSSFSEALPSSTLTKPAEPLPFLCRLTAAPLVKYSSQSLQVRLGMSICIVGQYMSNGISV